MMPRFNMLMANFSWLFSFSSMGAIATFIIILLVSWFAKQQATNSSWLKLVTVRETKKVGMPNFNLWMTVV